jgi:hypothetical protein
MTLKEEGVTLRLPVAEESAFMRDVFRRAGKGLCSANISA